MLGQGAGGAGASHPTRVPALPHWPPPPPASHHWRPVQQTLCRSRGGWYDPRHRGQGPQPRALKRALLRRLLQSQRAAGGADWGPGPGRQALPQVLPMVQTWQGCRPCHPRRRGKRRCQKAQRRAYRRPPALAVSDCAAGRGLRRRRKPRGSPGRLASRCLNGAATAHEGHIHKQDGASVGAGSVTGGRGRVWAHHRKCGWDLAGYPGSDKPGCSPAFHSPIIFRIHHWCT